MILELVPSSDLSISFLNTTSAAVSIGDSIQREISSGHINFGSVHGSYGWQLSRICGTNDESLINS